MQFIDLSLQQKRIRAGIENRIRRVLDHNQYIMGPEVGLLESELAKYTGTKHAISCSSGTDALLLALMAYGVGPGDAVITTPFTFVATAEVISLLGAAPIFADIEPDTFNISADAVQAAFDALSGKKGGNYPLPEFCRRQELRVRGIIGVDLFGLTADYSRLNDFARKHGLFVIEDAAQSFGAEQQGKRACSLADIGCTSFFPSKPLGGYGDGGMCFTDDDSLAEKIESIRIHGQGADKYQNVRIGINGRLDTFQAAVLLSKMEIFPEELQLRREKADRYSSLLDDAASVVICPKITKGFLSAWAQYSVLTKKGVGRPELQEKLKKADVPTAIYYPTPLHLQPAYAGLGYRQGDFPVSEDYASRIFSLPFHPYLVDADQESIASLLKIAP